MDLSLAPRKIYRPIKRYQTRIIRLRGDHGSPDSPLVCSLYSADIRHCTFEGVGLRVPPGEEDRLIEFDALFYTWGSGETEEVIAYSSFDFPISQNLSEALRALRYSGNQRRYLWVDAIRINQSDDEEKGEQVWNMLSIYQKATRVIAWLGSHPEDLDNVIVTASSISSASDLSSENVPGVWSIIEGLSSVYNRPWFPGYGSNKKYSLLEI
ncbi:heterokaryon incompatibility protein-domain-containing protein [Clohesyomyces aquaticus]|uniref:Heterokaryon incompatibility protein-domain-containing protein n=1 Tax=Clohesyomyces aquaticus TaxID=1231657 RepID=A0A1Y1ZNT8_9PLEO|nr:heterokaryon incompatibility protein-domain-containing protein [Clohesyomyces aquaticus]